MNLYNGYMGFHLAKVSYDFSVGLNFQNKKIGENKLRRFRLEKEEILRIVQSVMRAKTVQESYSDYL